MTVLTGLEVLLNDAARIRGMRVGLLSNAASITRDARRNVDALLAAGVNVALLFSPEHGFGGAVIAGDKVASGIDARTGLPIHSLYGATKRPSAEMLRGLDALLFDLQDVGARFYTYTTTLAYAIEACAEQRLPLIVLDRPNPIAGEVIEGPLLQAECESFVGHGALPLRYAMTIGELARFYAAAKKCEQTVRVVAMQGWRRDMFFDETALPWAPPSPNMPHAQTALFYPGMALVGEGGNCSAGALTPLPFECAGAPWLDGDVLAATMNALDLAGTRFRPFHFTPTSQRYAHAGQTCFGVQVHVTDRKAFRPVRVGLHLLCAIRRQQPARWIWNAAHFDLLIGNRETRAMIDAGADVEEIAHHWHTGAEEFKARRQACVLYG